MRLVPALIATLALPLVLSSTAFAADAVKDNIIFESSPTKLIDDIVSKYAAIRKSDLFVCRKLCCIRRASGGRTIYIRAQIIFAVVAKSAAYKSFSVRSTSPRNV